MVLITLAIFAGIFAVAAAFLIRESDKSKIVQKRLAALHLFRGRFLATLDLEDAPDFMLWVAAQSAHWGACYDLLAEQQITLFLNSGQAEEAGVQVQQVVGGGVHALRG